jgi:hypothetical protein
MAQGRIGKSLIDVAVEFATEEACLNYLEALRWPEGVRCVACDSDKVSKFTTKASSRKRTNKARGEVTIVPVPARHLYQCLNPACKQQFTATAGTIFHDTHLPLQKWMMAIALMVNAKKGVSAKQLERDLNVNYRTAWYLAHRIRRAMELGSFTDAKMSGTIEADETYVGGKYDKRRKRAQWDKEPVFGMMERGTEEKPSQVRAMHLPGLTRANVYDRMFQNISGDVEVVLTDDSQIYRTLKQHFPHESVNHGGKEYVRGNVHTNGIENFWSLLKRGVIGTFHQVSIKHLNRYISEFAYRFNNRENEHIFAITTACLLYGSAMPYANLTAGPSAKIHRNQSAAGRGRRRPKPE